MRGLVERLHGEIGDMLRDDGVRASVKELVTGYPLEDFVEQEMLGRTIEAGLVHIKKLPEGMGGGFEIAWLPNAGGSEERQTFSLD